MKKERSLNDLVNASGAGVVLAAITFGGLAFWFYGSSHGFRDNLGYALLRMGRENPKLFFGCLLFLAVGLGQAFVGWVRWMRGVSRAAVGPAALAAAANIAPNTAVSVWGQDGCWYPGTAVSYENGGYWCDFPNGRSWHPMNTVVVRTSSD